MLYKLGLGTLAAAMLLSTASFAATFDFDSEPPVTNEAGGAPLTFSNGGTDLSIYGWDGTTSAYAYHDSGYKSGIGVCKGVDVVGGAGGDNASGNTNECDQSWDDNMQADEWLDFVFTSGQTTVNTLTIFGPHNNYGASTVWIDVDGGGNSWQEYAVVNNMVNLNLNTSAFSVKAKEQYEAYVGGLTTVPVPAALLLFGSALIGFAGLSVRRKAA